MTKTHGMSKTLTYRSWRQMKERILNPNNKDYEHYKSRGVTIDPRWVESFEAFYADMGPRPNKRYTLERIDNTKGYYAENCCWDARRQQAINQGFRKDNPSGYYGVTPNGNNKTHPWRMRIGDRGRVYQLGFYKTKEAAAVAYNFAASILHGPAAKQNRIPVHAVLGATQW